MSKAKDLGDEGFKDKPFNGERARWEDYHRYLRITINKQEDLPENWLTYLFDDYPVDPDNPAHILFPADYVTRIVPDPPADTASAVGQRYRNDAIRREEKHNERVKK